MKSPKVISASRRTDIPAFYMEWFYKRLKAGFCEYLNPFNFKKHSVSLKQEDVLALIFWSKDFSKSIDYLKDISYQGYRLFFHYTINNFPQIFEPQVPALKYTLKTIKKMHTLFSDLQIVWRYDPVLVSDLTSYDFHLKNFEKISKLLQGIVKRCYISFPTRYGKVEKSFRMFNQNNKIKIYDPDIKNRQKLADMLADIAMKSNISIYSCCSDYLINDKIQMASCIDGPLLKELFFPEGPDLKKKPSRKKCGCYESIDIGVYDSCPHGCIYCYANLNKKRAMNFYNNYLANKEERDKRSLL